MTIPLLKSGDSKQFCKYRPISLLSVFSKIFEKLLANRIFSFLQRKNLLSPNQHGFREDKSTMTALTNILDFVYKNLDRGHRSRL